MKRRKPLWKKKAQINKAVNVVKLSVFRPKAGYTEDKRSNSLREIVDTQK